MKVLLSIATVLASATALAATGHADTNDAQFIQNIRNGMGITDGQEYINTARDLCNEMQHGKPYDQAVVEIRQDEPYWDASQASFFVSASAQAYCPEIVGN
jgi:Protein of unknown function (DUF732)